MIINLLYKLGAKDVVPGSHGYVRFPCRSLSFFEINWHLSYWAFPFGLDFSGRHFFVVEIFCLSLFIWWKKR